jgi:hypothetical protein
LQDWTLLVELILEWETYLMYIIRNVAKQTTGMGLRLMKFHAVLHLLQDMLLYGTPSKFDTASNESMQKPSKYAAKLTQRNESTFNQQTAQRLTEFLTIDFALSEAEQGRKVWEYFDSVEKVWDGHLDDSSAEEDAENEDNATHQLDEDVGQEAEVLERYTGGSRIEAWNNEENEHDLALVGHLQSALSNKQWAMEAVQFLVDLQDLEVQHTPN